MHCGDRSRKPFPLRGGEKPRASASMTSYPRRSQAGYRDCDVVALVRWAQVPGPVRSVSGVTSPLIRRGLETNRVKAGGIARSAQSSLGLGFWRLSTATSWRSTSSSASFDAGGT